MSLSSGLVTYGLGHRTTGITRYTTELARAFTALRDGPQVTLLSAGKLGPLSDLGLTHAPLPGCRRIPGLLTLGSGTIPRLTRRMGLDIVHDPTGVSPFLFGSGGARTVVTIHDVFAWSCPGTSTLLETLIYRYWLPRLLPRVDALITDSQASRADIVRFLGVSPARIRVVPLGVNEGYQPISPDRAVAVTSSYDLPDEYLLYLGSTRKHNNLQGLLSAFERLQWMEQTPSLVLVGVSAKECYRILSGTLGSSRLARSIISISHVPEADLPSLYSGALLFVRPFFYEGFGLPPLEAMACGTPVVCANAASLPEVVGDAAITVDPYDVEGLAEAMRRVLSDAGLREELRARGLERAKHFTWERTARETVEVYREVLNS